MRTDIKPEQENGVTATTQDVLPQHLNSIVDIAGTMADYTAESRFFTLHRMACCVAPRRFGDGLVVAGDVAYNEVHLYLAESNAQTAVSGSLRSTKSSHSTHAL
jgi:hypothetical protein